MLRLEVRVNTYSVAIYTELRSTLRARTSILQQLGIPTVEWYSNRQRSYYSMLIRARTTYLHQVIKYVLLLVLLVVVLVLILLLVIVVLILVVLATTTTTSRNSQLVVILARTHEINKQRTTSLRLRMPRTSKGLRDMLVIYEQINSYQSDTVISTEH